MNEQAILEISAQIAKQQIKHGSCNVEIVFHDGRITHYIVTTSVRTNVHQQSKAKGEEA